MTDASSPPLSACALLKQRRLELGLSLYAVSRRMREASPQLRGTQIAALSRWEDDTAGFRPSDLQLQAWASALGLEVKLVEVAAVEATPELDPPTSPRARRAA